MTHLRPRLLACPYEFPLIKIIHDTLSDFSFETIYLLFEYHEDSCPLISPHVDKQHWCLQHGQITKHQIVSFWKRTQHKNRFLVERLFSNIFLPNKK